MRVPAVLLAALATALAFAGCATRFESGPLSPIPRAPAAPGLPYAQVREYALASRPYLILLRFDGSNRRREPAVTMDVRNDTPTPVLLELSRARLRFIAAAEPGAVRELPVVAAGLGPVPRTIDLDSPGEPALELAPGEARTVWLAFAAPKPGAPGREASGGRMVVVLPVTAAGELAIPIHDNAASPDWSPRLTSAYGVRLGTSGRFFDDSRGRFNEVSLSVFSARGPLTASLVAGTFTLHERLRGGIAHAAGPLVGLDLALRPPGFALGLFAEGHHRWIDFDTGADEPDRNLFGGSVGLLLPLEAGIAPLASLRLGASFLFGDRTPYHVGYFAALDVRLFAN